MAMNSEKIKAILECVHDGFMSAEQGQIKVLSEIAAEKPRYNEPFIVWINSHYLRVHGFWCHRLKDINESKNYKNTKELWRYWLISQK